MGWGCLALIDVSLGHSGSQRVRHRLGKSARGRPTTASGFAVPPPKHAAVAPLPTSAYCRLPSATALNPCSPGPPLLPPSVPQIVSSSYCAAAYLQSLGFPGSSGKKVLLLGWRGVEQELQQAVGAGRCACV